MTFSKVIFFVIILKESKVDVMKSERPTYLLIASIIFFILGVSISVSLGSTGNSPTLIQIYNYIRIFGPFVFEVIIFVSSIYFLIRRRDVIAQKGDMVKLIVSSVISFTYISLFIFVFYLLSTVTLH